MASNQNARNIRIMHRLTAFLPFVFGLGLACASTGAPAESPDSEALAPSPVEGLPEVPAEEQSSSVADGPVPVAHEVTAATTPPSATSAESALPSEPEAEKAEEADGPPGLLGFLDLGLGDRVADLGTGSGYLPNQMARAVGRTGVVYTHREPPQRPPPANESGAQQLRREASSNVVVMNTDGSRPLSPEAKELHLVTFLFGYHQMVADGIGRAQWNRAIFDALQPGGYYVIADYDAPRGSGVRAARELHKIEERLVRADVLRAGFEFVEAAELSASVPTESTGGQQLMPTVRSYLLRFRKPEASSTFSYGE